MRARRRDRVRSPREARASSATGTAASRSRTPSWRQAPGATRTRGMHGSSPRAASSGTGMRASARRRDAPRRTGRTQRREAGAHAARPWLRTRREGRLHASRFREALKVFCKHGRRLLRRSSLERLTRSWTTRARSATEAAAHESTWRSRGARRPSRRNGRRI